MDNSDLCVRSQYASLFLQQLIDSTEPLCIKDPQFSPVYVSPSWRELFEFSVPVHTHAENEAAGFAFSGEMRAHEQGVVREKKSRTALVIFPVNKKQPHHFYFFTVTPLYDEDGKPGGVVFSGKPAQHLPMAFYLDPLTSSCSLTTGTPGKLFTRREWEIVFLLIQGKRPGEIASMLNLSCKSVSNRVYGVLCKLGIKNTPELITLCQKNGWHHCVPESFVKPRYCLLNV